MKPQGKLIRPPADSSDLDLLVYDAIAGLDAYGYWVSAKPAPGHEREFWGVIRAALWPQFFLVVGLAALVGWGQRRGALFPDGDLIVYLVISLAVINSFLEALEARRKQSAGNQKGS